MSSQRVAKIESIIQTVVAPALAEALEGNRANVTVTRVDAAPDLRQATVWIGLLGSEAEQARLWKRVEASRAGLQAALAGHLSTKYVPRLVFKHDTGGEYAVRIEALLRDS
jgi:ribosome-binding factor A